MIENRYDPEEVTRFEHATWSRCASSYVEGFGALVGAAVAPLLDELEVRSGRRMLDVGTGPGLVAAAAARRGADVVGVDVSEDMLAEARRRQPELSFETASADSLPFEAGSFDAVAGNFVLHHLGRPERALAEARRVLRPGGRAAFTVWADLAKLEAFGVFLAAVEEHAGSAELPHGPLFGVSDPDVFLGMAREAGFRDAAVRELPLAWRTSTLEPYLASFADWANLAALPAATRAAIEASARQRAEAYLSASQFVLPNPALLVSAEA